MVDRSTPYFAASSRDMLASLPDGTPHAASQVESTITAPLQAAVRSMPRHAISASASTATSSDHNRAGRGEIARTPRSVSAAAAPQGVFKATRGNTRRAEEDALEARHRMALGFPS